MRRLAFQIFLGLSLLGMALSCSRYRPAKGFLESREVGSDSAAEKPADSAGEEHPKTDHPSAADALVSPGAGADVLADESEASDNGPIAANPAIWGPGASKAVGREFEPIYFDFDSSALRFASRQVLREYAEWLEAHPDVWVTLGGHCDSSGSAEYNYNLGMARAYAVKEQLVGLGLQPARLFTISYGEERPAAEETSEETRALNRRVEFQAFLAPAGQASP
ncbi:OmpA family protein, partial [Candidatus Sumerlaeota bacterium]|nr:OmpA family protein [Candidatus Sumerlaeota bacterium]